MYKEILYKVDGAVATISFNRPDKLNALTITILDELKHALDQAEKNEKVVGIVLTGEGRGFSAGMDMDYLKHATEKDISEQNDQKNELEAAPGDSEMGENFQVTYSYLLSIRKPIIAAINGPCAGLSFAIAMLCDIRFATENTKFTTAFSVRGLIAEHGLSWILPRVIGPSRALDLLWTSRKFDGNEALKLGVVDHVIPQEEIIKKAQGYIENLAKTAAPISLMVMKRQVYKHLNSQLGEAMKESNQWLEESLKRPDFKEGVTSFIEKRPPNFNPVEIN